ncbi:C40 family peptidase [Roseibacillus persicicus]|uniref:NlpC/P60 domain-containing protein n=1 Tax=Roseibacillus persicicus TaxID=454148 RepID=A0A918WLW6_9BACT|nr:C40 family peptidase [Roseibacillus persicicus]GHC55220.1 hypothetical protein GCM10007100_22190 [Roseibacillus persicicus]
MQVFIRFALVAGFLWCWASVAQGETKPGSSLVTIDGKGLAVVAKDAPEIVKKVVQAANKIVGKPYKYGGGHGSAKDTGYDCSGAVSFVLRELGHLDFALSSGGFLTFGEKGEGEHLTVWARKGHVFLTVGGVRFDTQGQDEEDGPRWTEEKRSKEKFQARRLKAS